MRILLDECVPVRLRRYLLGHETRSVFQQGWAGIKNGKLLQLAQQELDVFLTVDTNLQHQQSLVQFNITVLALRAHSNALEDLIPLMPHVLESLSKVQAGQVIVIDGRG
jgi:predicted nuclease of predicted toxin-antitoxin system